jgi:Secretion system C-terminal sorting domain/Immune inhibitor A-like, MAM domain/Carboxypeptidase regulatory-like domain
MKKVLLIALGLFLAIGMVYADADIAAIKDAEAAVAAGVELTKAQNLLLTEYGNNGPVIDNTGGPDGFGYIWKDSEEVDGPTYGWIDITGTGTSAIADMSDDITSGPYPIGFAFPFYGANYSDFYVGSNGAINFDGQYLSFSNQALPTASYGAMIPWFWNDLDPADATDAELFYETMVIGVQNALVISFLNWDEYPGNVDPALQESITAQMILFEDGTIQMHYQLIEVGMAVNSHTIGIQDATGTIGLMALYNGDIPGYPYDGLAIEFSNAAVADASLEGYVTDFDTGDPIAGADVDISGTMTATDVNGYYFADGFFPVTVSVTASAPGYFNYGPVDVDLASGANFHDFTMAMAPVQTFFTDFESGPEPFGTDGVAWEFGTPTIEPVGAFSGVNAWSTYLDGDYQNSENEWLISGPFMVDSPAAFMTYMHWYNYESGWDGYNVNISADGGATWSLLTPEGGYPDLTVSGLDGGPGFTQAFDAWEQVTVLLGAYAGQEVMVAFRHGTDSSVNSYSGATIDDFALYGTSEAAGPGPATLTLLPVTTDVPAEGGEVVFGGEVMSYLANTHMANCWFDLTGPNGTVIRICNLECVLDPGLNVFGDRTYYMPDWAPAGEYTLTGNVGIYPIFIADTDEFTITKHPPLGDGLFEDFEDGLAQDFIWFTGDMGSYMIDGGFAKLDVSLETDDWGSGVYIGDIFTDFTANTNLEYVQSIGNSVGLLFRGDGTNDGFYSGYAVYLSNGYWSAWVYTAGIPANLVGWTADPAILFNVGDTNNLQIVGTGDTFDVSCNGTYVGSFVDNTIASGFVGFTAAYTNETWFDDINCMHPVVTGFSEPITIGELDPVLRDHMGVVITDPADFYTPGVAFDRSSEFTGKPFGYVADEEATVVGLPTSFAMGTAYPNPFNPTANVSISLPEAANLTISVFNVMGQQVATLASGQYQAGVHNFVIDGSNLSSGLYFIQAQVPGELHNVQKITLMK